MSILENPVARVLRSIAFIEIAAGIIIGLILGNNEDLYGYSTDYSVVLLWSAAGFISGMLFFGFAEIIDKLHSIDLKLGNSNIDINNENETNPDKKVYTRKEASELYQSIMTDKKE